MRSVLLFLVCAFCVQGTLAQVVVEGQVRGMDGEVLPVAHVEVWPHHQRQGRPLQVVAADGAGYRVEVPGPGLYRLRFAGPLHERHDVALYVEDEASIGLDVQLRRAWLDRDQSFTRIATGFTNFDYDSGSPLQEQEDGSYKATVLVPADTLVYTLPGAWGRSYEGQVIGTITAEAFRYVGNGEYQMIVAAPGDEVTIEFHRRALDPDNPPEAVVTFDAANQHAAQFAAVWKRMQEPMGSFTVGSSGRAVFTLDTSDEDRQNAIRWAIHDLEQEIKAEDEPFRRQLLLLYYLNRTTGHPFYVGSSLYRMGMGRGSFGELIDRIDPAYVQLAMDEIPPTSWLWSAQIPLMQVLVEHQPDRERAVAYIEEAVANHPDPWVRQYALLNLFDGAFARRGMTEEALGYLETYRALYETPPVPIDQELQVVPGRRAPDYWAMAWGEGQMIRSDSLKGQVVLLDFEAEWCEACHADDALLKELAAKYADDGLHVVRVSLDLNAPAIDAAAATSEVPWMRLRGNDGFKSAIAMTFEVLTLPHRVLIDRDGVILAVGGNLFGERLEEQLASAFASP